jgi:signal transduction histidine kinase
MTIAITLTFGVTVPFRIAGPIYRMRNLLAEMSGGNFIRSLDTLRQGDEFEQLYPNIHDLKKSVCDPIKQMQEKCNDEARRNEDKLLDVKAIADLFKTTR